MQACAALLCGNCVVIKPSERCPRTTHLIRQIFRESEFPDGVVEVAEGAGETVEQLIAHESVRKIIFTGSYGTGKRVAELCGRYFKTCILELGGCGAAIVCDDADLSLAARGIAWSAFYANGLSCVGTKRVFVHASVSHKFIRELQKVIKTIKTGDPLDPATEVGKTQNKRDVAELQELVRDAVENGAILLTSEGEISDVSSIDFDKPIVLLQASPTVRVMSEEIGAPLVAVREVNSVDQAIREANDSVYGLGASVWSKHSPKAQSIARQLNVGMVWINDSSVGQPEFPWGGVKHSGWGRLFSKESLSELTNVKVISHDRRRTSIRKSWWFPYSAEKFEIFMSVNQLFFGQRKLKAIGRFVKAMMRSIHKSEF
jgi:succinate-semialdehyde dehydrogenase/glutarate-semialdehyde dehydrogenase